MCPSCQASRETNGLHRTYDCPKCNWCTARLIQQIGKLRTPTSEQITARRRVALADAMSWGHDEKQLRILAGSKELALEPIQNVRKQLLKQ